MDLLSHPFRLGVDGRVVTVEDGTDDAVAEAIAVTALTRKGERVLVPDFGVTEPVFAEVDVTEINATLATFGPEDVTVTLAAVAYPNDTTTALTLSFEQE